MDEISMSYREESSIGTDGKKESGTPVLSA